jgi:hypothetical protein
MARVSPIVFNMITDEKKLTDIVLANVPEAKKIKNTTLKKLARVTAAISKAWLEIHNQSPPSRKRLVQNIGAELKKPDFSDNIREAPSPRALVQTVRRILDGESVKDAVQTLVLTTVRDIGLTANALANIYETL